ncbi:hypothetical protein [Kushneria phosphatilytica]|uniref:Uncharacterized protein n=1 Tax=Kushneria phosphatilytica TaxID=657387 RepID=A0A1S1NYR8_9GAMM|nr:hypothetical protein [Kushneria phosphatilytica]OHV12995.1 hypothetical protein BH688_03050 [Kushneria phosphatilytica]QEL10866.1 hypothetical protein FY550_06820 [Kushneria phosphatilytica]
MIGWIRRISQNGRSHLLVAGVAAGIAASTLVSNGDLRDRLDQAQATISQTDQELQAQRAESAVANYGLWYALTQEQKKAGRFEAQRNDRQEALDKARSYVAGLRAQVARLQERLNQKDERIEQLESRTWTGQVRAKSGDGK